LRKEKPIKEAGYLGTLSASGEVFGIKEKIICYGAETGVRQLLRRLPQINRRKECKREIL